MSSAPNTSKAALHFSSSMLCNLTPNKYQEVSSTSLASDKSIFRATESLKEEKI